MWYEIKLSKRDVKCKKINETYDSYEYASYMIKLLFYANVCFRTLFIFTRTYLNESSKVRILVVFNQRYLLIIEHIISYVSYKKYDNIDFLTHTRTSYELVSYILYCFPAPQLLKKRLLLICCPCNCIFHHLFKYWICPWSFVTFMSRSIHCTMS